MLILFWPGTLSFKVSQFDYCESELLDTYLVTVSFNSKEVITYIFYIRSLCMVLWSESFLDEYEKGDNGASEV